MKIGSFDEFVKANGELIKHPVSIKTNSGDVMEFYVAMIGAVGRDKIQAHSMALIDRDSIKKATAQAKAKKDIDLSVDFSKYRGNSALLVSIGAINEAGERFLDSPEAIKYLDTSVNTDDLNTVAELVDKISGTSTEAIEEAEKK